MLLKYWMKVLPSTVYIARYLIWKSSLWNVAGIGSGSFFANGANWRNFSHCLREIASATELSIPGICFALKVILNCINNNTSSLSRDMILFDVEDWELIMLTSAMLSVRNWIFLPLRSWDHIMTDNTIGANSKNVMSLQIALFSQSNGHSK